MKKCLFVLGACAFVGFLHGTTSIQAEESVQVDVQDTTELQDALKNESNAEISIENDVQDDWFTVDENKELEFTTKQDQVEVDGNVWVKENGQLTMSGPINYAKDVYNEGQLTINDGTFYGSIYNYGNIVINNGLFKGQIVNYGANATFTMKNGIIDGVQVGDSEGALSFFEGAQGTMNGGTIQNSTMTAGFSGAVLVHNSSFTMNGGSVQNNVSHDSWDGAGGVFVYAVQFGAKKASEGRTSTFVMNGGTIQDNVSQYAGAGVFTKGGYYSKDESMADVYSLATFIMNGGTITRNKTLGMIEDGEHYAGLGGGVHVNTASKFIMNGGEITENESFNGAGVATYDEFYAYQGKTRYETAFGDNDIVNGQYLRDWATFFPASFEMNGGTIARNIARMVPNAYRLGEQDAGVGGGIYIASGRNYINGGVIEGNWAESHGGGLYVSTIPYAVYLKDTIVYENTGGSAGGGVWFCPTGEVEAEMNGVTIFDNVSDGQFRDENGTLSPIEVTGHAGQQYYGVGADVSISRKETSTATASLSNTGLGGSDVVWYKDGIRYINLSRNFGLPGSDNQRYVQGSDANEIVNEIVRSTQSLQLKSFVTEEGKELAKHVAKVIIRNNWANRGGGIGSNGDVVFERSVDISTSYEVEKRWTTDIHPESVTVWLVREDGYKVKSVELNAENNWSATFEQLSSDVSYYVEEVDIPDWKATYTHDTNKTTIVNEPIIPTIDLTVKKQWIGKVGEMATIHLFANGSIVQTVVLSAANNWTYTFEGLDQTDTKRNPIEYTIEEVAMNGYTTNIVQEGTTFFVTNKEKPVLPEEPEEPEQPKQPKEDQPVKEVEKQQPIKEVEKQQPIKEVEQQPKTQVGVPTSVSTNWMFYLCLAFGMIPLANTLKKRS